MKLNFDEELYKQKVIIPENLFKKISKNELKKIKLFEKKINLAEKKLKSVYDKLNLKDFEKKTNDIDQKKFTLFMIEYRNFYELNIKFKNCIFDLLAKYI
jgi:inner membrane protein involved in colicin E2 resistance